MATRTIVLTLLLVLAAHHRPVSAQTITEFPLPTTGSSPLRITAGPDGSLWFTESTYASGIPTRAAIGRITTTGSITEFLVPDPFSVPRDIVAGPDGNIWFTQADPEFFHNAYISRITPEGSITQFPGPDYPFSITVGPDGNLWFTQAQPIKNQIGRMTTAGVLTLFPLPTLSEWSVGIAAGPDGRLWFTESSNGIGRITTAGVITKFPIPTTASGPGDITAGPDGNLWFTEFGANKIGRITPEGSITEFSIPTAESRPNDIAVGPDGNLWFTEPGANQIGRITTAGVITEFPIPTAASSPEGITTGPDGNIWFTESVANKIGRLTISSGPAIDSRILPVVGSTPGVGGSFFKTSVQLHNSTSTSIAGRIVFHPSGASGGGSDPALSYTLSPGQTESIADLLPAIGLSGLGSADLEVTTGSVPAATVRVFNDAGASGTTGFTEEAMRSEEALRPGQSGVLLLPVDLTSFRFNLGVRTLEGGAGTTLTLRDGSGVVVATVSRSFPATYHEQQSAGGFLGVTTLPPGGSISISVGAGSAIFYGATVDNRTGDPSLQIARAAP